MPDVRQSAFALLGDLAISAFNQIRPHLDDFMAQAISQVNAHIDNAFVSVCNNAVWASGEIALQHGNN